MVEPVALPGETDKALQLRRMKRIPLLLLCLMAVIFFLTLHSPYTWAAWLHAFAEAGMVGGLVCRCRPVSSPPWITHSAYSDHTQPEK